MSELIARKLSTLPVGAHVSLAYADGASSQTVSGVVTDNNFQDGIEIQTSDGMELVLAYNEISRLLIQKKPENAAIPARSVCPRRSERRYRKRPFPFGGNSPPLRQCSMTRN